MNYWLAFQAGVSLTGALMGCAALVSDGRADVVSVVCTLVSGGLGALWLRMSWVPR